MAARSGKLGDFVMTMLLLLIGAGLVYGSAFEPTVGEMIGEAIKMPLIGSAVGVILILSVLLRLVGGCRREKAAFINFDSEDGSVGISTKAICDFIERIGKEFSAVKSIDSKLLKRKDSLDIALSVKVLSGNKIPELSHVLQQRVRESVRESLGLNEIRNITIKVQEIIGEPAKSASSGSSSIEE
jgi:uncharacterized alkaline shock family protein YloU